MNDSGSRRRHLDVHGIQYVRAIGALLVVLSHSAGVLQQSAYFDKPLFNGILSGGAVGVNIFFVVSGFIITIVSLQTDAMKPSTKLSSYVSKRFTRIVPFLWLCILVYAALKFIGSGSLDWQTYVNAFFLWPFGEVSPNVVWTLRHEALFYAVFALAFFIGKPKPYLLFIWCFAPIGVWAMGALGNEWVVSNEYIRFFFHSANLEFGCGVILGLAYQRWTKLQKPPKLPAWTMWALLALASMLAYWTDLAGLPFVALAIVSSFVVLAGMMMPAPGGPASKLFRIMGDASYSIYLTHNLVFQIGGTLWIKALGKDSSPLAAIAILFCLAVLNGILIHYAVEKPLIKLFRNPASKLKKQSANVA